MVTAEVMLRALALWLEYLWEYLVLHGEADVHGNETSLGQA